jgi:hypothetical protein
MKRVKFIIVIFFVFFPLITTACSLNGSSKKIKEEIEDIIDFKEVVYTQVGLWTEKSSIIATNYSRGEFIPVNSPVKIMKIRSAYVTLKYGDSVLYLKNTKYTKLDIYQLFARTFDSEKVDLEKFDEKEREAILFGDVIIGMSKDAVITSRGYPPAHQTSSLASNSWKFWESRFNTIVYRFRNDRVFQIKK